MALCFSLGLRRYRLGGEGYVSSNGSPFSIPTHYLEQDRYFEAFAFLGPFVSEMCLLADPGVFINIRIEKDVRGRRFFLLSGRREAAARLARFDVRIVGWGHVCMYVIGRLYHAVPVVSRIMVCRHDVGTLGIMPLYHAFISVALAMFCFSFVDRSVEFHTG